MKIAFDVDGVVLESMEIITKYINQATGGHLAPADLAAYELGQLNIEVEILRGAIAYLYGLPSVPAYDGAQQTLEFIHRCREEPLLFITGRREPESAFRQLRALDWGGKPPEMIVTGGTRNKTAYLKDLGVDIILEDDPMHLEEYLDAGVQVGLMVRPWNAHIALPVTHRFHGWNDVREWFMGVAGPCGPDAWPTLR
jgi:hypothetical protein